MPQSGDVLVFGASGYIGTHLTSLLQRHYQVRAAARNIKVLEGRDWLGVEIVQADALVPATLSAALAGIKTAFYLVHSMAVGADFAATDCVAATNFAKAAAAAGVKKIIYLGGLVPPDPRSAHLISRQQTGQLLRQYHPLVIEVRAAMVVGPGSAAFEVIRDLVNHLPLMITPKWVKSKSTPIALDNLLEYLTAMLGIDFHQHRIFDVGGPEALSYLELMQIYAAISGHKFYLLSLPVLTPRLSSYWLRLVTSVPTNVARALIDGLAHDVIAKDAEIRQLLPIKLLTYRQAVQAALLADQQHNKAAQWVEGCYRCRDYQPDYAFYAKKAGASIDCQASVYSVWQRINAFAGEEGHYYAEPLWFLRRLLDWLLKGPSFRRRRRHPQQLRVGDVADAWRVIHLQQHKVLTFLMEMKAPGSGVLEFTLEPQAKGCRLTVTAYWHPAGPAGLCYWYALLPAHSFLFKGLVRRIAQRAISADRQAKMAE